MLDNLIGARYQYWLNGYIQQSVYAYTFIVHSGLMNITVDYRRTNRKIDTGKKLKL